jgi:hypothetical protein
MTSVHVEDELRAANRGAILQTLWQRIARGFDNFVTRRSREAVPATVLRRSRRDHDRCRRLMLRGSITSRSGRSFERVKHDHE